MVALVLGVTQFCVNFNAVYLAERYITSGLVATVFALLLIPNSLLAWALPRPEADAAASSLRSRSRSPGSACCSSTRCDAARSRSGDM